MTLYVCNKQREENLTMNHTILTYYKDNEYGFDYEFGHNNKTLSKITKNGDKITVDKLVEDVGQECANYLLDNTESYALQLFNGEFD